jgi:hypothetical protein
MPHIIVVADSDREQKQGAVMLRERVSSSDLESRHFANHLLERLEWAVADAHEAERSADVKVNAGPGPGPDAEPGPDADPGNRHPQRSARVLITAS